MSRSKKVQRDEKGHAILDGAKTFGTVTKPTGGRRQPRHHRLKEQASSRMVRLMDGTDSYFKEPKPLDPEQIEALKEQNEFARLPHEVKLHYYHEKLNELELELKQLEESGNQRKCDFMRPVIKMEIAMWEEKMMEIYQVIKSGEG